MKKFLFEKYAGGHLCEQLVVYALDEEAAKKKASMMLNPEQSRMFNIWCAGKIK
jgi:hypothetical protein